jgi:hypothetical protein
MQGLSMHSFEGGRSAPDAVQTEKLLEEIGDP